MPYLESKDAKLYYEVSGKGEALVLLNGIMMSTASWIQHVEKLSKDFKVITLDFRDQGRSSTMEDDYDLSVQSDDLLTLLDHLKVEEPNILGVSYGAHVAEYFALRYPNRVKKLILSNAVDKTDNYLREVGRSWELAAQTHNVDLFFKVTLPMVYSREFYNTNLEWISSRIRSFLSVITDEWLDAFVRLSRSGAYFDLSDEICKISIPTLLICAEEDIITPKERMEKMHEKIKNSQIVSIPKAGHAAFLEKVDLFCDIVKGFLK